RSPKLCRSNAPKRMTGLPMPASSVASLPDRTVAGTGAPRDTTSSVRLEVQPPFALEPPGELLPLHAALRRHVAQRGEHAGLHALEAADVDEGVAILQQRRQVDGALPHQVLHVALRRGGRARERETHADDGARPV